MAICYDDSVKGEFGGIDMSKIDATKCYLNHYGNKLYLSFVAKNGTQNEKWQAEKELIICERKLKYWERHRNFIGSAAVAGMEKLNKQWRR
jgi:hypothetical protein